MKNGSYQTLKSLLMSEEPEEILRGLELAETELKRAHGDDVPALVETITPLFYIDPLDRPDLAPLLDRAITLVASVGTRVIPTLVNMLGLGDLKAQLACGEALGRIGANAIDSLIVEYHASTNTTRRCMTLYALGKIRSREVARAASVAIQAVQSNDLELRDTALRAIGKFAEVIPPGELDASVRSTFVGALFAHVSSPAPHLRAKAFRSLGKLARCGHMTEAETDGLIGACRKILGAESQDWDRVYLVRKEAEEALHHCGARLEHAPAG